MPIFATVSQDDFLAGIQALSAQLGAGDWRPDHLVGVGRGGLVPATFLSHAVDIPLLSIDISARVAEFGEALLDRLAARTADGQKLLFVDDINDSGGTIAHLRQRLVASGGVADRARFAVLLDNVRSAQRVDYHHRTIDRAVDKSWFVFPWEAVAPAATVAADADAVPERLA
ncbi:MAG TPA: phosphoribosyltransferase domain-containing protein [Sphingomonas sp.]|jgi:hypothetical protein|uniref:phosphoribosyltransferase n=1 Tax=Sphingomonas sp. TaxID=28214 RepID=UPI002EDB042F